MDLSVKKILINKNIDVNIQKKSDPKKNKKKTSVAGFGNQVRQCKL